MKPERSKATFVSPKALARSAIARPTALAASMLPVVFNRAAHVLLQGRRGNQNLVAFGREDLRIDVLRRAVHRQAQRGKLLDLHAAAARAAQAGVLFGQFHVYFFFASFSEIFSSEYFTPLPL